ncbi:hypothetical protein RND81_10G056800 [Saponaria officinalis]|uniref:Uncharacterized protein n=1 Tax=Saponaria officinalis TaxID=3572 RepID=A0AAW1HZD5_SAPOF
MKSIAKFIKGRKVHLYSLEVKPSNPSDFRSTASIKDDRKPPPKSSDGAKRDDNYVRHQCKTANLSSHQRHRLSRHSVALTCRPLIHLVDLFVTGECHQNPHRLIGGGSQLSLSSFLHLTPTTLVIDPFPLPTSLPSVFTPPFLILHLHMLSISCFN